MPAGTSTPKPAPPAQRAPRQDAHHPGRGPGAGHPKLRSGTFFPSPLERRRRIDQALYVVIIGAHVHGVSTRAVDDLAKALRADSGISKSEVSRICADLDEPLTAFRTRPLDHTRFPYIYLDATYCKARVNHQIVTSSSRVWPRTAALLADRIRGSSGEAGQDHRRSAPAEEAPVPGTIRRIPPRSTRWTFLPEYACLLAPIARDLGVWSAISPPTP